MGFSVPARGAARPRRTPWASRPSTPRPARLPPPSAWPSPLRPASRPPVLANRALWRFRDPDSHPTHIALKSLVFLLAHQNFPLAGMVGLPDDAFVLHPLHERGSAVVADPQSAL